MQPLNIKYNRALATAAIVIGVLLLLLSLGTQAWVSVIAGAVIAVLGILMIINPVISIESQEVQVRNPLGMTLKRFPVTSPADLALEGKTLRHVPTGKKVTSLAFGANKADVEALRAQLPAQG